jgi:hypothetical protein
VTVATFDRLSASGQLACQFCGASEQLERYQAVGGSLDGRWAVVCGDCHRFDPSLLDSETDGRL